MISVIYDGVEYVCTTTTPTVDTDIEEIPDVYSYNPPRLMNGRFAPIPEWDF